jgi:hypothetical protein
MSYRGLAQHFASIEDLPIPVDDIIRWIVNNTIHKNITLHAVNRDSKSFRGAFHRTSMPSTVPYNLDPEVLYRITYAADLSDDWKRLVIVKEVLHVFDRQSERVNTAEQVRRLIPSVILPEMRGSSFAPAINDQLGAFRALVVLIPENARRKLKTAFVEGRRSIEEIAHYCGVPDSYVDIWLRSGEEMSQALLDYSE